MFKFQIQLGQIWKRALIQCNRVPCIRAFLAMVEMRNTYPDYIERIFHDWELELAFFQWSRSEIYDIDMIEGFYVSKSSTLN